MLTRLPEFLDRVSASQIGAIGAGRDSTEGSYIVASGEAQAPFEVLVLPSSRPGEPLAALIPLDADTPGRVEALIRYWRARRSKPLPADKRSKIVITIIIRFPVSQAHCPRTGIAHREAGNSSITP